MGIVTFDDTERVLWMKSIYAVCLTYHGAICRRSVVNCWAPSASWSGRSSVKNANRLNKT